MQLIQIIIINIISVVLLFNVSSTEPGVNSNKVTEVKDQLDRTIFYSSEINMYPCVNDECQKMSLTMFWDKYGNYYKYELAETEQLTKLNHKGFSEKEYIDLHNIILDTNSDFKFLALADLTEKQSENSFYETDAVSGATIEKRDFKCINGAVKTTYQLWHIANGAISDSISDMNNIEATNFTKYANKSIDEICQLDILQFMEYITYLESKESIKDINILSEKILIKQDEKALLFYNYLTRNKIKSKRKLKTNLISTVEFKELN